MPIPVGISNLPNQRHKIASRASYRYNILLVGESGLGKTTFINTLLASKTIEPQSWTKDKINMISHRINCEEDGFFVDLNIIDCKGYGDFVNNQDSWLPIVDYVEANYKEYIHSESKAIRKNIDDGRVHACLYFIEPTGHTLKPIDVVCMKKLGDLVNLIPVISKADTLTKQDLILFKQRIVESITANNISIYLPPLLNDDDGLSSKIRDLIPFSIICSENEYPLGNRMVRGRKYLWGVAEVENEEHCDFVALRNLLIRTHMDDIIACSIENYEKFRFRIITSGDLKVTAEESKMSEEQLRKKFTEQVKKEEQRFRAWEQKLIIERDRLNRDLEMQELSLKALRQDIDEVMSNNK